MTGKAPGGTSWKFGGGGGFGRKFPEGGPDFLEVALVWKFPDWILPKQTSKKFASEPPKLPRSPSRSGSMVKLVLALSYCSEPDNCFCEDGSSSKNVQGFWGPWGFGPWGPGASWRWPLELQSTDSSRRRTNVQQLTCKIDLPFSFYFIFSSLLFSLS